MQAVILAGGLGTRLKPYTDSNPKPMIPIQGKPFLEYLLNQLVTWGIKDVVLLLGYRSEVIQEYFGDGDGFGVKLSYCVTPVEYDTGARIRAAVGLLQEEFLLMYCDNYCPIDYRSAELQFKESKKAIQITGYTNKDGYTKNNIRVESDEVISYDKGRKREGLNAVDIGYAFIKKDVLSILPETNCNFEAEIYQKVVDKNGMGVFLTEHRYYSIGSWERIELTKEFFRPRKVVFLDRDGTINERPPKACYVEKQEDFRWLPGAKEAISMLKQKGYEVYLITNQPGIARGCLTWKNLDSIHGKMMDDLHKVGAKIDGIYICPHGWNDGCECRKPKPGMLYQAQKEHSIDLTKCILIGDDERDIEAGRVAGIENLFRVDDTTSLWDVVQEL